LCEKFNNIRIDILHSKAGNNKNTKSINNFISGKTQILVCTTMIEVGVDVPNATCIVVEDSERFGLAQLHQLRGRVGRGDKQSYCYLVYKESISETAYARIRSLESHSNGFKIAEEDLKLRGAGEYLGNRQSGYNDNLKIASPEDIIVNFNLIKNSQKEILLLDKEKKDMLIKRWRKNTQEEIQL
jgi:ATP-dependent DNA helicase RecG